MVLLDTMSIEHLNTTFGIPGKLTFVEGKGNFPIIEIHNGIAKASISVYGAHVLSFQPAHAPQVIFLSENAVFQVGKAIRGGIPICWPWFGPDPEGLGRPNHGFVRNRLWNVIATDIAEDGSTTVTLGLEDTDETQELWPHSFDLRMEISVGTSLSIALVTRNTGDRPFPLTQALHTYFTVGDITQTKVLGLEGKDYLDKVDEGKPKNQEGVVAIAQEVDRIYLDVPSELVIEDGALGRRICITSTGNNTAVVWNPWIDKSAQMADLGNEDYKRFICVETTNAATDVVEVPAGGEFRLAATYS